MKCEYCDHAYSDHHTLADTPTDAAGNKNPPKGTVIPCDVTMADGKGCGCTSYIPKRNRTDPTIGPASWSGRFKEPLKRVDIKAVLKDPAKLRKLGEMFERGVRAVGMDHTRPVCREVR